MPAMNVTAMKDAIHAWVSGASGLSVERVLWDGQPAPEADGNTLPWISLGRFAWSNPGNDWSQYAPNPFSFTPKTVTLNAGADTGTSTAHGLATRDGPIRLATTGSLAGTNLAINTDYWAIFVDANTLKFATSFPNADAGIFIDIQGAGTGVHTIVSTADTRQAGKELIEYARGARRVAFNVTCYPPLPATDATEAVTILSDVSAKAILGVYADALSAAKIGLLDPGEPRPIDGIQNAVYFEPRAVMTVVFSTVSEVQGTETIIDYANLDENPGTHDFQVDANIPPNKP